MIFEIWHSRWKAFETTCIVKKNSFGKQYFLLILEYFSSSYLVTNPITQYLALHAINSGLIESQGFTVLSFNDHREEAS